MPLKLHQDAGAEQFWIAEFNTPYARLEVDVRIDLCGVWVGNDYFAWEQLDQYRARIKAARA